MTLLISLLIWLNRVCTIAADWILWPVEWIPGWLSVSLIAMVTGVFMLWAFKYTSNQRAIKRTRDRIKSNLLALSLFKEDLGVALRLQGSLLRDGGLMLIHSLVPMAVMLLPMCLLLGQLALRYQKRPLQVLEEAVVTVQCSNNNDGQPLPEVILSEAPSVEVVAGPIRVTKKRFVAWKIRAKQAGRNELRFEFEGQTVSKQLPVGSGFPPTSMKRPAAELAEILLHPREAPFPIDSAVRSIEVDFPDRKSWIYGTDAWLIYWFIASMIAAFIAKPLLGVNI